MIKTGVAPLRGVRTNALVVPISIRGIDLTDAVLEAYVLQNWDNDPSSPEIEPTVSLDGVDDDDGTPVSNITLSISAALMAAIPPATEPGEDLEWVWYLDVQTDAGDIDTKNRYLEGKFVVGGSASGSTALGSIAASIANQDVVVDLDGVVIGPPGPQGEPGESAYVIVPNQTLFPFSFAFGDGLQNLVDDPLLPNVGGNNHAFGLGALLSLTGVSLNANPNAGYGNCAFGPNVMRVANNAFDNTFMGYEAGRKMVDGFNNAGLGPKTLYECTTGYRNVALGTTSLYSGTTLYENIAIGVDAGFNATTCFGMVLGGYQAGYRVTSASHGVGLGWKALGGIAANDNTSQRAVAVGYRSAGSSTTASDFVSIGANCLVSLTTGNGNCFGGSSAGQSIVTGSGSAGWGDSVLLAFTGSGASAFGTEALAAAVSSSGLCAFGYQAGKAATASNISVFGFQAALNLVNGGNNAIFGRGTASTLTSGGSNSIFGDAANVLDADTSYAVVFGAGASAGSDGIAIGAGASAAAATGATSAHDSAQLSFGSTAHPVAVRGDASLYPAAGASAGYMRVELNDNVYALELKAIA